VRKVLCCLALAAAWIPLVARSTAAQDVRVTPVPSLDWIIATKPVPGTLATGPLKSSPPSAPAYCRPCLFYGGDIDPNSPTVNGLSNENTLLVSDTTAFVPFIVPGGQTWQVSGLLTNDLAFGYNGIDPMQATWSISTGLSGRNAGTTIASGTGSATFTATGRNVFGLNEYTVNVNLGAPGVHLRPGIYWLSVVPQCTNGGNSNCDTAQYFLSNTQGLNYYGPREPLAKSFFSSQYYGYFYANACFVSTYGCREFSAGVEGKSATH